LTAVLGGAVLGGLAGYLFFTDRGRQMLQRVEPAIEDFARELNTFRSTIQRAVDVASDSWGALNDATGPDRPRGSNVH
jgi:hypothetical protein